MIHSAPPFRRLTSHILDSLAQAPHACPQPTGHRPRPLSPHLGFCAALPPHSPGTQREECGHRPPPWPTPRGPRIPFPAPWPRVLAPAAPLTGSRPPAMRQGLAASDPPHGPKAGIPKTGSQFPRAIPGNPGAVPLAKHAAPHFADTVRRPPLHRPRSCTAGRLEGSNTKIARPQPGDPVRAPTPHECARANV